MAPNDAYERDWKRHTQAERDADAMRRLREPRPLVSALWRTALPWLRMALHGEPLGRAAGHA